MFHVVGLLHAQMTCLAFKVELSLTTLYLVFGSVCGSPVSYGAFGAGLGGTLENLLCPRLPPTLVLGHPVLLYLLLSCLN